MAYGDIVEYEGKRYKNITPNMTSNTTPAPYAVTVSDFHNGWLPYYAFSDPPQDDIIWWWTSSGPGAHWGMFDYAQPTTVDMIIYEVAEAGYLANGKITIQGSNNGSDFNVITGTTIPEATKTVAYCNCSVKRCYFMPDQQLHYRYYRFDSVADAPCWYTTGYVRFFELTEQPCYLLHDSAGYKTIGGNGLQELMDVTLTPEGIRANGFSDMQQLAGVTGQLGNIFEVLRYSVESTNASIEIDHLPTPQLIMPVTDIDLSAYSIIKQITLTTTSTNGAAKVVFSFDGGASWRTYANGAWAAIEPTADAVAASGVTAADVAAIPAEAWTAVTGPLRVAYCLAKSTITDDLAVAQLTIIGDTSSWDKARHMTDYDYEYPSTATLLVKLLADSSYKINRMNGGGR